jgi:NTE family protein
MLRNAFLFCFEVFLCLLHCFRFCCFFAKILAINYQMTSTKEVDLANVNTLVFEGGSVKGIVYVGALGVLHQKYLLDTGEDFLSQITDVGGTSAGSIMAMFISMNLNIETITAILKNTSFSKFQDAGFIGGLGIPGAAAAVYKNGYLCEGDAFMKWAQDMLKQYAGSKDITFKQMKERGFKKLHVFAVRLNDSRISTFNADNTPDVPVALAIRMSMSIPVFFKPVCVDEIPDYEANTTFIRESKSGTVYYVDGGVLANYPYSLVKQVTGRNDDNILGFRVDSEKEMAIAAFTRNKHPTAAQRDAYRAKMAMTQGISIKMISDILTALQSPQETEFANSTVIQDRTIASSDCNVSTFEFDLSKESVQKLLDSGKSAAETFLNTGAQIMLFLPWKLPYEALNMKPEVSMKRLLLRKQLLTVPLAKVWII